MPPAIDDQSPFQPPYHPFVTITSRSRRRSYERLSYHLRQEHGQSIVVSKARDLNRQLHPRALSGRRMRSFPSFAGILVAVFIRLLLLLQLSQVERIRRENGLFHLRFDSHNGLRSVCEADACAAIGSRENACFGRQWPELRRRASIRSNGTVR